MPAFEVLRAEVGVKPACLALGMSRATYYRSLKPARARSPRPRPHRALGVEERARVLAELDSDRFADKAPLQVYAQLLDEGTYLCSARTMYRLLAEYGQVRERRALRRHPEYIKPRLVAPAPNRVWSWDITKVPGPARGVYYSLYVALDIFSRYVVGWTVAHSESAAIARDFLIAAVAREAVRPGQLTCHEPAREVRRFD